MKLDNDPTSLGLPNMYAIEIGVPIPVKDRDQTIAHALRILSEAPIGASMLFPVGTNICSNIARQAIAAKNKWMTCKTEEGNARVWKIADPIF